jgi:hypothetical protein
MLLLISVIGLVSSQTPSVPMPAGKLQGVEIRVNGGPLAAAGKTGASFTIGDQGIAGPFELPVESMGFINEQLKAGYINEQYKAVYMPVAALQKAAGTSGRFEVSGTSLRAIPGSACTSCAIVIQQQGTISDGVRIIIQDGRTVPLVPLADVARALGGKIATSGGVYSVTAGGCGACVLAPRR